MIKKFLSFVAVGFLCTAILDPVWASGLGRPIPWFRDIVMLVIGAACFYILVRFRKEL